MVYAAKENTSFNIQEVNHLLLLIFDTRIAIRFFDNEIVIDVIKKRIFSSICALKKDEYFNRHLFSILDV